MRVTNTEPAMIERAFRRGSLSSTDLAQSPLSMKSQNNQLVAYFRNRHAGGGPHDGGRTRFRKSRKRIDFIQPEMAFRIEEKINPREALTSRLTVEQGRQ